MTVPLQASRTEPACPEIPECDWSKSASARYNASGSTWNRSAERPLRQLTWSVHDEYRMIAASEDAGLQGSGDRGEGSQVRNTIKLVRGAKTSHEQFGITSF